MNDDLDKVRQIFLTGVDEEDRAENEEKIREWERSIIQNKAFAKWQKSDISVQIAQKARDTYKEIAITLALNRQLSDEQRQSLWARQDACQFLLGLIDVDAKGALERIHSEIRTALSATN